jgi:hypothetical protein
MAVFWVVASCSLVVYRRIALMMAVASTSETSIDFQTTRRSIALGGLVVSVLDIGPKVRGFKPGRGRWILRVIKSAARLPSEGK